MKQFTIIFMLAVLGFSYGQQYEIENIGNAKKTDKVKLTSGGYPVFLNDEMHAYFDLDIKLDSDFQLQLQGYYDTYLGSDVFRVPVSTKWYATDKLYFFSGVEAEIELDKYGNKPAPPALKFINGFGYEVNKSLFLEAKHDLHFNKTSLGNYATPNLFSVSGKYKF